MASGKVAILAVIVLLFVSFVGVSNANAQTGFFDNVVLDGGASQTGILQFSLGPSDNADPFHQLIGDVGFVRWRLDDDESGIRRDVFRMDTDAPNNCLVAANLGVGIGTLTPTEMLHLRTIGEDFDRARILVEDASATTEQRLLLHLQNNGGVGVNLENTSSGHTFTMKTDLNQAFIMGNSTSTNILEMEDAANQHSIHASSIGVGIGTSTPLEMLHIRNDDNLAFDRASILIEESSAVVRARELLKFKNKGGTRILFHNTDSQVDWLLATDNNDRFTIKIAGLSQPMFEIRKTGYLAHTVAGTKNLQLYPNGNLKLSGVVLTPSDRNLKENFEDVDLDEILEKVAKLPITSWNYKHHNPSVKHIGPVAQDFMKAFKLGDDDTSIATVDADGVALAAIQGLYRQSQTKDKRIAELESELKVQTDKLSARIEQLEALLSEFASQR